MKKVEKYVLDELSRKGGLFFGLIDPVDYKDPKGAVNAAAQTAEAGADVLLIGGSIGAQGELLDEVTKMIKEKTNIPIILFPGNIGTVTKHADAIYFMSLLNSRNAYWISQAQTLAAPLIKQYDIETLPVGYIVVEPGGTVGWVGDANLIPRARPKIAASLAMAAEFTGCRFVVTDTGSDPAEGPVPLDMVKLVSKALTIPYVVAGGIRTPEQAKKIIEAGADIIQVGTALEKSSDIKQDIGKIVTAVREAGKKKI